MLSPSHQLQVCSMLHRCSQQYPHNISTIDVATGRQRTYAETVSRVSRLASGLEKIGLSHGGRVALVMLNSDRYFESFFTASWAGGIVVPINIRLAGKEMVELFQDCEVEIVIVDDAFAGIVNEVKAQLKSLKAIVFAGEGALPKGTRSYEEIVDKSKPMADRGRGGDDTFGLFYTGGTTGKPKGVELTHSNILANAMGHVAALQYTEKSRYLHSAPMFHLADGASTFGITLVAGSHVFVPKFDPKSVLQVINDFEVSKAMMVPVMLAMLLQEDEKMNQQLKLNSLEHVLYGASPMPEALLEPSMRRLGCQFIQGYGMTETSPAITMLPPDCHEKGHPHLKSVGRPVFWVEAKIVDANMNEVPRGTIGEIVTKGPHVMKGYWRNPKWTKETVVNGWMKTGDGGYMNSAGFIFIVDRIKDMIITGGENVYSAEVENCVMKFSKGGETVVAMCAAIGLPDPKLGEKVSVFVVPKEGKKIDKDELIKFCKENIGGYKVPREVFIRDMLPVSGAGKILKNELRKEFNTDAIGRSTSKM